MWQILNLTPDTHPIHFHLVNVQLIQRQKFDGVSRQLGPYRASDAARSQRTGLEGNGAR